MLSVLPFDIFSTKEENSNKAIWISSILILGGIAYPLSGLYTYLYLQGESSPLFYLRFVIATLMIVLGTLSFFNSFLKQHILTVVTIIAYIINIHTLAVAYYSNFETNQLIVLIITQVISFTFFNHKTSLLTFSTIIFLLTILSVFLSQTSFSKFLLGQRFISITFFMLLIIYGKIRMLENISLKNELFTTLFNQSEDAMLMADPTSHFIFSGNKKALEFFDLFSMESLIGKDRFEFCKEPVSQKEKIQLDSLLHDRKEWTKEIEFRTLKENVKWGIVLIKRIGVDDKFYDFIRITDISQQKTQEQILHENQFHLKNVQKVAKLGSYVCYLDSDKMIWSDELYKIFNISLYKDVNWNTIISHIHPEDSNRVNERFLDALENETEYIQQYRVLRNDSFIYVQSRTRIHRDMNDKAVRITGTIQDITHIKIIENQLRENEQQFRSLVNNIPGVTFRFKVDNLLIPVFISENISEITGYSVVDFLDNKMSFKNIVYEPDRERLEKCRWEVLSNKTSYAIEYRIVCKDGSLRWILEKAIGVKSQNETLSYLDGFMFDLTSRKMEEAEIRAQHNIINSLAIISKADLKGNITYVNDEFLKWSKYEKEEVMGKNHRILKSGEQDEQFFKNLWKTISRGKIFRGEIKNKAKDGSFYWVDAIIAPIFGIDGRPKEYIAQRFVINEKKKREEEIQSQLTAINATLAAVEYDIDGYVITANTNFLNMTGYELYEIVGKNNEIFIEENERSSPEYKTFWTDLKNGVQKVGEYKNVSKNGEVVWISGIFNPVRTHGGQVYKILKLAVDITDKKMMEEVLKEKELTEKTSQMKDQFLANISHEIRTPLNAIVGLSGLMKNTQNLSEKQIEYMNAIQYNSDHLLELINEVLDLSKIEAGKMIIDSEVFNLHALLNDLCKSQQLVALRKGIYLNLHIDKNVPEFIFGDYIKLNQILLNLISNAIKFTHVGHIGVTVGILHVSEEQVELIFSVKDTGIGIPEEKLDTIFEKFTQVNSHSSRKYGGTGLGLTITKKMLELLDGKIQVFSKPGSGTEFFFNLKFELKKEKDKSYKNNSEIFISNNKANAKILLVEDNQFNKMVACDTILDWDKNIKIDFAENGKQAIDLLEKETYDLILLDIQMPEMDGYETAHHIRNQMHEPVNKIPIVAITAHAVSHEIEKCMRVGMNDYILKPFNPMVLFEKIKKYIFLSSTNIKNTNNDFDVPLESIVDLDKIQKVANFNSERIKRMIHLFLEETHVEIQNMENSIEMERFTEVAQIAHAMIPKFLYMGMSDLSQKLRQIELFSKQDQVDKYYVNSLLVDIHTKTQLAYSELNVFLKTLQ